MCGKQVWLCAGAGARREGSKSAVLCRLAHDHHVCEAPSCLMDDAAVVNPGASETWREPA